MTSAYYDPELPFLADLEERVRAQAQRAARPRRRPWPLSPLAGRMTRRTAILVGLLCLLGATAFGARAVFFTSAQSPVVVRQGAFVVVAHGHEGEDQWTLRLYTREGELCRALVVVAQSESSRCAPRPGAQELGVTSVASARRRYLFGVTGSRVSAVSVRAGALTLTVATRTLDRARARAAGLPRSTRYFLAILQRPLGQPDPPATLTGLDAAHRRIGSPRVDCLQAEDPRPCRA